MIRGAVVYTEDLDILQGLVKDAAHAGIQIFFGIVAGNDNGDRGSLGDIFHFRQAGGQLDILAFQILLEGAARDQQHILVVGLFIVIGGFVAQDLQLVEDLVMEHVEDGPLCFQVLQRTQVVQAAGQGQVHIAAPQLVQNAQLHQLVMPGQIGGVEAQGVLLFRALQVVGKAHPVVDQLLVQGDDALCHSQRGVGKEQVVGILQRLELQPGVQHELAAEHLGPGAGGGDAVQVVGAVLVAEGLLLGGGKGIQQPLGLLVFPGHVVIVPGTVEHDVGFVELRHEVGVLRQIHREEVVGIQEDHIFALCVGKAQIPGRTGEFILLGEDLHPLVLGGVAVQNFQRAVGGTVIHTEDLNMLHGLVQQGIQILFQIFLHVINGHDDADQRRSGAQLLAQLHGGDPQQAGNAVLADVPREVHRLTGQVRQRLIGPAAVVFLVQLLADAPELSGGPLDGVDQAVIPDAFEAAQDLPGDVQNGIFHARCRRLLGVGFQSLDPAAEGIDIILVPDVLFHQVQEMVGAEIAFVQEGFPILDAQRTVNVAGVAVDAVVEVFGDDGSGLRLHLPLVHEVDHLGIAYQIALHVAHGLAGGHGGIPVDPAVVEILVDVPGPLGQHGTLEGEQVVLVDDAAVEADVIVLDQAAAENFQAGGAEKLAVFPHFGKHGLAGVDAGIVAFALVIVDEVQVLLLNFLVFEEGDGIEIDDIQIFLIRPGAQRLQGVGFQVVVAVQEIHIPAPGDIQRNVAGAGLAAVFLADQLHIAVFLRVFGGDLRGTVGGTVVDAQDLDILQCLTHRAVEALVQVVLHIIHGYNDRNDWRRRRICHRKTPTIVFFAFIARFTAFTTSCFAGWGM